MENITIQSDINNLIDVERFVTSFCDLHNINNYAAAISMSLLQAVENAIIHGNNNDPSKKVFIEAGLSRGGVYFQVTDQGDGFNYQQYTDASLDSAPGNGLFLMHKLSDRITFSGNGNCVRMDFYVTGINSSLSLERIMSLRKFYLPMMIHA